MIGESLCEVRKISRHPDRRIAFGRTTMRGMDQMTCGLDPLPQMTRKEVFLEETNQVAPWAALVVLIKPLARGAHQALGGRPLFPIEVMLRIHCLQLRWNPSDMAVEEQLPNARPLKVQPAVIGRR